MTHFFLGAVFIGLLIMALGFMGTTLHYRKEWKTDVNYWRKRASEAEELCNTLRKQLPLRDSKGRFTKKQR